MRVGEFLTANLHEFVSCKIASSSTLHFAWIGFGLIGGGVYD